MPVTIHLVRHAQGFHNLSREYEALRDPQLTDLGKQQCAELKATFPHHDKLTRLFASPLRRTLSTCLLSFVSETEGDGSNCLQVVAIPELQEVSDAPCDTGSNADTLKGEFKGLVDLSRVYDDWNLAPEWTSWDTKLAATDIRANKARMMLREMLQFTGEDEHVAIVTHGAFVHFLTNDFYGVEPEKATGWKNTEYRSYHFSDSDDPGAGAKLIETPESWKRRHGDKPRPTEKDQEVLRQFYLKQLEPYATPSEHLKT
ncbi:phosphoglycerate mutase [Thelonectria olida]|uniref:Phosphoglycerate mutase n=1 Tax=Thelonectria olida TaxID=1576542 RepID=A0A9P8WHD9_9HYPO|nr:phosphoglycerate mutase [Thelonectria olida]